MATAAASAAALKIHTMVISTEMHLAACTVNTVHHNGHSPTTLITVQQNMFGKLKCFIAPFQMELINSVAFLIRSNLSSLTGVNGERSLRFTDSYLTSTISTTSGLGSNYTTNTSGSSNTQNTPSPRRKTNSSSFVEFADIPEQEANENPHEFYKPGNYSDYRLSNQATHYFNRIPNYGTDDNLAGHRNYGYFGKQFYRVFLIDCS